MSGKRVEKMRGCIETRKYIRNMGWLRKSRRKWTEDMETQQEQGKKWDTERAQGTMEGQKGGVYKKGRRRNDVTWIENIGKGRLDD
jgi:hypothetical protein